MAKIKNASGNWMETLHRLIDIVKTEYPDGGKFPSVPEMSRRLHVAENTYCKALRTICKHGLAQSCAGRAGTVIIAPYHRHIKIGILVHSMLSKRAFSPLIRHALTEDKLALQIVDVPPKKLLEQLLILNISALYAIRPRFEYFPYLKKLQDQNFPVAILEFYTYSEIEEAACYNLPYFHLDPDSVAESVCKLAETKGFGNIMLIDRSRTILTQSFENVCPRYGRIFTDKHFLTFSMIGPSLAARIKQRRIELIYSKCSDVHAEQICEQILKLPVERRPALVFPIELKKGLERLRIPGIRIAGYFNFDDETYEIATVRLLEALHENRKVAPEKITHLEIR